MSPTGHAVAMLAVPALTLAAVVAGWKGRPPFRRVVLSLLSVFGGLLMVPTFVAHLCGHGNPDLQILVWAACALLLLTCISRTTPALWAVFYLSLVMAAVCWDYTERVHDPGLTGNPRALGRERRMQEALRNSREALARADAMDTAAHPAGWIPGGLLPAPVEAGVKQVCPEEPVRVEFTPFWHSPFTALWSKRSVPVSLWYPGGTMKDAAPNLEWRDRPRDP